MQCLVFCVEAGSQQGVGHLMRCLALAQAADAEQIPSYFLLTEQGKHIALSRHDWVGHILTVQTESDMVVQCHSIKQHTDVAAVIVDGYGFSPSLLTQLRTELDCIVLMDDTLSPLVALADLVVNPAGENQQSNYQALNSSAHFCLGGQFRLLREQFNHVSPVDFPQRLSLTINYGGSDPCGLTVPTLRAFHNLAPDIPLRVITGPSFSSLPELKQVLQEINNPTQHIHNAQDMADVWQHSRLAISAAGGAQFELHVCHTPAILVVVADNQVNATENAQSQGWCECFDGRVHADVNALVGRAIELWKDDEQLNHMHMAAKHGADSVGAQRVLEAIARLQHD